MPPFNKIPPIPDSRRNGLAFVSTNGASRLSALRRRAISIPSGNAPSRIFRAHAFASILRP